MPFGYRFTTPEECVELDAENRLIGQKFAHVLEAVDSDPSRFLAAAVGWLAAETGEDPAAKEFSLAARACSLV